MYRPDDMPDPIRREGVLADLPPHYRRLFETGLKTAGRIVSTDIPMEDHTRVAAMVCGMVSQFDVVVGRVLDVLERLGLAENTVVAFLSDHGQMPGDRWMHSMPPRHMDGTLRVPSIWRFPGVFRPGMVSGALADAIARILRDPTLAEQMGADARRLAERRHGWRPCLAGIWRCFRDSWAGEGQRPGAAAFRPAWR